MIAQQPNRIARAVRAALNRRLSAAGVLTLALACGLPCRGDAAGIAMHGGTYGPPGLTNGQAVDYVLIDQAATLNGGFTNAATGTIAGTSTYSGIGVYEHSTINGALINLGTIGSVDIPTFGIETWNSTLTAGLRNSGHIASEYSGIFINNTVLRGGIVNSGSIASHWSGILVQGDALAGGISNSGSIVATNSGSAPTTNEGIAVDVATVTGGIGNSGRIVSGLTGISVNTDTFAGGIANSGSIVSEGNAGIRVYADTFTGGLTTSGTIAAGQDTGIYLDIGTFDGGLANSGSITAANDGIHVQGGAVTGGIGNSGNISSNLNGIDVALGAVAGGIVNAGRIVTASTGMNVVVDDFTGGIGNSGHITSGTDGIYANGTSFAGGIANSGTIRSDGEMGIRVATQRFQGGILNTGSIAGAKAGVDVVADSFAGGISNSGSIASDLNGIDLALNFLAGGITNDGSIVAASAGMNVVADVFTGGLTNSGTIAGGTDGITVNGTSFVGGIANSGTIRSDGESGIRVAVQTFENGIVNTGSIAGAKAGVAVVADSFAGGISNSGRIASSAGDGITVVTTNFAGGLENSGMINAPLGVGIRVTANIAGAITNTGIITGGVAAIDAQAATGPTVMNLRGGAIYGDINLSPTFADTINATAGSMTGNIVATGPQDDGVNFILNGGTFTFNGSISGVNLVFVDPGTLYLNGNISGVNTVHLAANTILSLGTTANVNTLNFIQDPTATLDYSVAANGRHGIINAGSVSLAGNLQLPIPNQNGLYAPNLLLDYGTLMTWITRNGTFNPLNTGSMFLNGSLSYGPSSLTAQVVRLPFNAVAANLRGNADAVATGLENAYPAAYNRMDADAIVFYAPLFRYTAVGQYSEFLEAVSGASYANTLQASLFSAQLLNTGVDQRLSGTGGALGVTNLDQTPTAAGARTLWGTLLGRWAKGGADTNAPGFKQDTSGFAFGADYRLNTPTLVGLVAGYQHGRINFDNHSGTDTTSWQLGAYGQYDTNRWYGNGLLTFGWNGYESQRQILLSNAGALTRGSYNGTALVLYGEGGYKLPLGPATIKPMLGLGYVSGHTDAFTERGGVYRLHVQGASFDSFPGNLGLRAELEYRTAGGTRISGEARAIWQHEFLKDQQSVKASFAALPGSDFRVVGSRFASNSAILGLGVKAQVAAHTELSLNYDARVDKDYTANALFGAVRMDW